MQTRILGFAALALGAALSAQSPLTTTYAGGNGLGGNTMIWFDLTVNTSVTINQVDVNALSGSTAGGIDFYTRPGSYVGFDTSSAGWTLQGSVPVAAPAATGTPTPCVFASPFVLAPGNYGVAIAYTGGLGQAYTNGPLGPFSTAEMTLTQGGSGGIFTGVVNTPRVFNGSIYYTAGSGFATASSYGTGCPARSSVVVYELFQNLTFDLNNIGLLFVPNANGSYTILPGQNQWFAGFTNNLALTDDSTAQVTCPFPFPHAGGSATAMSVSSNGFLWLSSSTVNGCCTGSNTLFLSEPARIAPCWMDLNPGAGGGVFADLNPATGEYVITWNAVPEYGNANVMTMQIALQPSGIFEIRYQAGNTNSTHVALAGYSMGGGAADPGSSNLSDVTTAPIVTGSSATPLTLNWSARPTLGTNINLVTGSIPAGTALGVNALSFVQINPGFDLTPLGAAGCRQYVSPAYNVIFVPGGASSTLPLTIPNNPTLAGLHVYAQSLTFSAGYNTLGIVFSNGVDLKLDIL